MRNLAACPFENKSVLTRARSARSLSASLRLDWWLQAGALRAFR